MSGDNKSGYAPSIKIPLALLTEAIYLLEHLDVSHYDCVIRDCYDEVYIAFLKKAQSIELRDAYARIIHAKDEDERNDARLRYLSLKRLRDSL